MRDHGTNKTFSSFTFPVHAASENTSSFTVKDDAVDTQWLINKSAQARKLINQRSNVDLSLVPFHLSQQSKVKDI